MLAGTVLVVVRSWTVLSMVWAAIVLTTVEVVVFMLDGIVDTITLPIEELVLVLMLLELGEVVDDFVIEVKVELAFEVDIDVL